MMKPTHTTARWLGLIVGLQVLILLSLWTGTPLARADGIPDAGAQREAMINQLQATNAKLDALTQLLSGGKLEVSIKKPATDR